MILAIRTSWALLLGIFLMQIGNGLQGTVLGVRGSAEAFNNSTMGIIMAGYFAGFLLGAQTAPFLLRQVGHVRVFSALASIVSAAFILYPVFVDPWAWTLLRVTVGFCFSGLYVVSESWLNESTTNESRGQTLSAYLIVQMGGIILAQGLLNVGDSGGYELFVLMSVAVSIAITPMLLSPVHVPRFETANRMRITALIRSSPLGCFASFMLGAVFSCLFGMSAVYGSQIGLTNSEVSIFVGAIFAGGLVAQWPVGWLSDRTDRRTVIVGLSVVGAAAAAGAAVASPAFWPLVGCAFMIGCVANPLYSVAIAHTNDFVRNEEMASASAGLITLNGTGAMFTPVLVGALMERFGTQAFMLFLLAAMAAITAFALARMTLRPTRQAEEILPMAPLPYAATSVAGELAQDWAVEQADTEKRPEDQAAA